ncbi:hypothetical protein AXK11_07760 [Cephaloticoccus primus]|uniref:ABC transporter domain-containing protein n=1 Tax=Cephaloticoccus primus TaxID=1548207 RepID=A0A139SJR6_9BACT|nr:hypothetical protein AXK11_07760 [Cephaloticoccus primus]
MRASVLEKLASLFRRLPGAENTLAARFQAAAQRGFREIQALRSISLQIGRGEVVGLIGYNGAGKSTLLQIIAGTLSPSSGQIAVRGRVAALLELGSGMNPDFTGRENAYLYGSILGVSRQFLDSRMHAIEAFAEIGQFFDDPVRTYSTGMAARLAFAVLTQLDPDILIVDEALSVGDAYFQHKSINLIRQFQEAGKTMLVVSHDAATIKTMCSRAVILERGLVIREGPAGAVCDYYNALVAKKQKDLEIRQIEREKGQIITRSGDRRAIISDVELLNTAGAPSRAFTIGEEARIVCLIDANSALDDPTVGIILRDRLGNDVFGSNTHYHKMPLGHFEPGQRAQVTFSLPLRIGVGQYLLTTSLHSGKDHLADNYDWQDNAIAFSVLPSTEPHFVGSAQLPLQIEVSREQIAPLRSYEWGQELDFGVYGNAARHKLDGWSTPEDDFTWSQEPEAALHFDFPASAKARQLHLQAAAFCHETLPRQRVCVSLGEHTIGELAVSDIGDYSLRIPAKLLAAPSHHKLTFALPDAAQPSALGISNDARLLGIRLFRLRIE